MPDKYTLVLDARDIDLIGRGIAKLPIEEALATYQKIGGQVMQQNAPAPEPTATDGV